MVAAKVTETMSVSEQATKQHNAMQCNAMQEFNVKALNVKKLKEVESREEYQVKI